MKPATGERVVLFSGDDRALMIENTPALGGTLPNGGAPGEPLDLPQCVRKQVSVRAETANGMVIGLPAYGSRVDGRVLLQSAKDELAAITAARCARLPIFRSCGLFEVGACSAEFRCMKDGLAAADLFEHCSQIGINVRKDFVIRHDAIVRFGHYELRWRTDAIRR